MALPKLGHNYLVGIFSSKIDIKASMFSSLKKYVLAQ